MNLQELREQIPHFPRLSEHFLLEEFFRSERSERAGLANATTDPWVIGNLKMLCDRALEPLRELAGAPLVVTSGYRTARLNTLVGGARNSGHLFGRAADIVPLGTRRSVEELFRLAAQLPEYDQIIYEKKGGKEWLHVSYSAGGNRRERFMVIG